MTTWPAYYRSMQKKRTLDQYLTLSNPHGAQACPQVFFQPNSIHNTAARQTDSHHEDEGHNCSAGAQQHIVRDAYVAVIKQGIQQPTQCPTQCTASENPAPAGADGDQAACSVVLAMPLAPPSSTRLQKSKIIQQLHECSFSSTPGQFLSPNRQFSRTIADQQQQQQQEQLVMHKQPVKTHKTASPFLEEVHSQKCEHQGQQLHPLVSAFRQHHNGDRPVQQAVHHSPAQPISVIANKAASKSKQLPGLLKRMCQRSLASSVGQRNAGAGNSGPDTAATAGLNSDLYGTVQEREQQRYQQRQPLKLVQLHEQPTVQQLAVACKLVHSPPKQQQQPAVPQQPQQQQQDKGQPSQQQQSTSHESLPSKAVEAKRQLKRKRRVTFVPEGCIPASAASSARASPVAAEGMTSHSDAPWQAHPTDCTVGFKTPARHGADASTAISQAPADRSSLVVAETPITQLCVQTGTAAAPGSAAAAVAAALAVPNSVVAATVSSTAAATPWSETHMTAVAGTALTAAPWTDAAHPAALDVVGATPLTERGLNRSTAIDSSAVAAAASSLKLVEATPYTADSTANMARALDPDVDATGECSVPASGVHASAAGQQQPERAAEWCVAAKPSCTVSGPAEAAVCDRPGCFKDHAAAAAAGRNAVGALKTADTQQYGRSRAKRKLRAMQLQLEQQQLATTAASQEEVPKFGTVKQLVTSGAVSAARTTAGPASEQENSDVENEDDIACTAAVQATAAEAATSVPAGVANAATTADETLSTPLSAVPFPRSCLGQQLTHVSATLQEAVVTTEQCVTQCVDLSHADCLPADATAVEPHSKTADAAAGCPAFVVLGPPAEQAAVPAVATMQNLVPHVHTETVDQQQPSLAAATWGTPADDLGSLSADQPLPVTGTAVSPQRQADALGFSLAVATLGTQQTPVLPTIAETQTLRQMLKSPATATAVIADGADRAKVTSGTTGGYAVQIESISSLAATQGTECTHVLSAAAEDALLVQLGGSPAVPAADADADAVEQVVVGDQSGQDVAVQAGLSLSLEAVHGTTCRSSLRSMPALQSGALSSAATTAVAAAEQAIRSDGALQQNATQQDGSSLSLAAAQGTHCTPVLFGDTLQSSPIAATAAVQLSQEQLDQTPATPQAVPRQQVDDLQQQQHAVSRPVHNLAESQEATQQRQQQHSHFTPNHVLSAELYKAVLRHADGLLLHGAAAMVHCSHWKGPRRSSSTGANHHPQQQMQGAQRQDVLAADVPGQQNRPVLLQKLQHTEQHKPSAAAAAVAGCSGAEPPVACLQPQQLVQEPAPSSQQAVQRQQETQKQQQQAAQHQAHGPGNPDPSSSAPQQQPAQELQQQQVVDLQQQTAEQQQQQCASQPAPDQPQPQQVSSLDSWSCLQLLDLTQLLDAQPTPVLKRQQQVHLQQPRHVTQVPRTPGLAQVSQTQSPLELTPEVADLSFHDRGPKPCVLVCESFPFQKDAMAYAAWCNAAGPAALAALQRECRLRNFGSFQERQQYLQQYMQQHDAQQRHREVGSDTAEAVAEAAVAASNRPTAANAVQSFDAGSRGTAAGGSGGSSGWQLPWVRVFTEEYEGRQGFTRRFLAATYSALWRRHITTPPGRRHLYEVIQAGGPCHLYFDLEYSKTANPNVCGDELVNILVRLVRDEFQKQWGIDIRKQWVLELDSSTTEKFSRHLLVRVPGWAFRDNAQVGAFVRLITSKAEAVHRFYLAKEPKANPKQQLNGQAVGLAGARERVCFVDGAVYSKNRHFRLLGSSKGGKRAVLEPSLRYAMSAASRNALPVGQQQLFLMSLISNVHPDSQLLDVIPPLPAVFAAPGQQQQQRIGVVAAAAGCANDELFLQVPARAGSGPVVAGTEAPNGQAANYRTVKATWGPLAQQLQQQHAADASSSRGNMDAAVLQEVVLNAVGFIEEEATRRAGAAAQVRTIAYCGNTAPCITHAAFAYSLIGPGSHMCANINRNHKNNHVFFLVDFANGAFSQKCHDPDCWGFRSPWQRLPAGVWQRERLLGDDLEQQQG